jgi:hypothetical protein
MRGGLKLEKGCPAGILLLHYPYPGAGMQHAEVREVGPGTVEVVDDHNLPRMPDECALLSDVLAVPGVRDCLGAMNARERSKKVPTYRRILQRIREWKDARAAHLAAKPIRVAVHEDEASTEEE